MKVKLILLLIMFLELSSCTDYDYVERDKYQLEAAKKQLIPYHKGQKINFIHSKGYAFDFTVVVDTITWGNNKFGFERTVKSYYDSFQKRTVKLVSDYPDFWITLNVSAESNQNKLHVMLNRFNAYIPFDENYKLIPNNEQKLHESILINNKIYKNVIELYFVTNSDGFNQSIFYNDQQGLLQIKYSDDETFSINN